MFPLFTWKSIWFYSHQIKLKNNNKIHINKLLISDWVDTLFSMVFFNSLCGGFFYCTSNVDMNTTKMSPQIFFHSLDKFVGQKFACRNHNRIKLMSSGSRPCHHLQKTLDLSIALTKSWTNFLTIHVVRANICSAR